MNGTVKGADPQPRKPAAIRDWKCQECGKRMTMAQASRAMSQGCAKCGGSDVDLVETA